MIAAKRIRALPQLDGLFARLREKSAATSAKRGALFAFAIRVASAGIAYLSQILLARWIGAFEFGVFAYVWVIVLILGSLSSIGLNTSVLRFLPEYREGGRLDLFRGFLLGSRLATLAVAVIFLAVGLAVTYALQDSLADYYLVPLVLAFFCLPGYALTDIQDGVGRSQGWMDLALVPPYIQRPLLLLICLGFALWFGFEANAVTAIGAALIATYISVATQVLLLNRRLAEKSGTGDRAYEMPLWLKVSAPIVLMQGFVLLMQHVDILALNAFVTPEQVAVYYAAIKTTGLVAFVHFAVTAAYSAGLSEHFSAGRHDALAQHVREAAKWTFWPSLAATVAILAVGLPLLWLFGSEFTAGYPVMFVLACGLLMRAAVGPAETILTVLGHQNLCAMVMFGALCMNIALNLALIPVYGPLGAAAATVGAIAVESVLLFWLIKRKLGLHALAFGAPRPVGGGR